MRARRTAGSRRIWRGAGSGPVPRRHRPSGGVARDGVERTLLFRRGQRGKGRDQYSHDPVRDRGRVRRGPITGDRRAVDEEVALRIPQGPVALTCGGEGIDHAAPIHYRAETVINAPLSTVWDLHTDVERYTEWQQAVATIERLDPGPLREGCSGLSRNVCTRGIEPLIRTGKRAGRARRRGTGPTRVPAVPEVGVRWSQVASRALFTATSRLSRNTPCPEC